jgi:hypothetical protein
MASRNTNSCSSSDESSSDEDEEIIHRKNYESKVLSQKKKCMVAAPIGHDKNQLVEMQAALKASGARAAAAANEVGRLRVECEKLRRLAESGKDTASALSAAKEETANARRRAAEASFTSDRLREQLEVTTKQKQNPSFVDKF